MSYMTLKHMADEVVMKPLVIEEDAMAPIGLDEYAMDLVASLRMTKEKALFLLWILCLVMIGYAQAADFHPPESFKAAKRALYTKVYPGHGRTLYTGCEWRKRRADLESCGLQGAFSKKWRKRARRIEAEHVIPASWMYRKNGHLRRCAIEAKAHGKSLRKYCRQHGPEYRQAHNDLVNLYPAVGAINGMRSAKPFAEHPSGGHKSTFRGNRTIAITSRVAIPDPEIRGDIARIAFYMQRHYGVTYSRRQEHLFHKWDREDPVSQDERVRCERIRKVQGRCVFD